MKRPDTTDKLSVDEARLRPHLRAGASPLLERHRLEREQAAVLAQGDPDQIIPKRGGPLTKPGDPARLRGIPAIGRSVTGAIRGTDPGKLAA